MISKRTHYLLRIAILTLMYFCAGCSSKILIDDAKYESTSYPMFGNSSERNFYIPKIIGDSLKLRWTSEVHGSFNNTSVTVFQDYIFVPDLSGRVYAFNIESGKELGQVKYKGAIRSAPVVNHLKIIIPVLEAREPKTVLYNYDFQQGKEISEIAVDGNIKTDMVRVGDEVLFVTEQGKAYRFHSNTSKIWEFNSKVYIHSIPVLSSGAFVFGNDKGEVISINAQDGSLNYRKKIGSTFECGFTGSGNNLFCADNMGTVYSLDKNSGEIIWKYETGYKITLTPVFDKDYIYVGNLRGDIYKLEKSTGKFVWKIQTDGVIDTTPLLFEDYLLQPDLNKKLYFVDIKSGTIKKTIDFENRAKLSPVYYKDKIILGIDNGEVKVYDIVQPQTGLK
ncbi:MAG: PQQ-binding-like beta-propeller repeat protein [Bacillota bacterium]